MQHIRKHITQEEALTANPTTAYQANFKVADNLFNIYSDNGSDFLEQLDFFAEEAVPKIVAITQVLSAGGAVAQAGIAAPAAQQTVTAPAPQYGQPTVDTNAPLCEHGQPMKKIPAGISKASGKPYPAFFACNQPRGQQCNARVSV